MRHRKDHRKLSRTASHRKALLRNQVTSLFMHGRIETTVAKAKESRRLAERIITYTKKDDPVHARRLVARYVHGRDVIKQIFDDIAPHFVDRNGGYTRILKSRIRKGDAGEMAILELVKSEQQKEDERKALLAEEEAVVEEKKSGGLFGRKKKKKDEEESDEA